jgi:hypothetical protein
MTAMIDLMGRLKEVFAMGDGACFWPKIASDGFLF